MTLACMLSCFGCIWRGDKWDLLEYVFVKSTEKLLEFLIFFSLDITCAVLALNALSEITSNLYSHVEISRLSFRRSLFSHPLGKQERVCHHFYNGQHDQS